MSKSKGTAVTPSSIQNAFTISPRMHSIAFWTTLILLIIFFILAVVFMAKIFYMEDRIKLAVENFWKNDGTDAEFGNSSAKIVANIGLVRGDSVIRFGGYDNTISKAIREKIGSSSFNNETGLSAKPKPYFHSISLGVDTYSAFVVVEPNANRLFDVNLSALTVDNTPILGPDLAINAVIYHDKIVKCANNLVRIYGCNHVDGTLDTVAIGEEKKYANSDGFEKDTRVQHFKLEKFETEFFVTGYTSSGQTAVANKWGHFNVLFFTCDIDIYKNLLENIYDDKYQHITKIIIEWKDILPNDIEKKILTPDDPAKIKTKLFKKELFYPHARASIMNLHNGICMYTRIYKDPAAVP